MKKKPRYYFIFFLFIIYIYSECSKNNPPNKLNKQNSFSITPHKNYTSTKNESQHFKNIKEECHSRPKECTTK